MTRLLVRRAVLTILIVGVVAVGAGLFGRALPAGFIPDEDQGIFGVNVQLPPGASLERTGAVLTQVEEIVAKTAGRRLVSRRSAATGSSRTPTSRTSARSSSASSRGRSATVPTLHVKGIMAALQREFVEHPRGDRLPVQHPDALGLRRLGRLQLPAPGPERHAERRRARRPVAHLPGRGPPAARARQPLHLVRSELSPGEGGARPGEGAHARESPSTTCSRPCRRCWAAPT